MAADRAWARWGVAPAITGRRAWSVGVALIRYKLTLFSLYASQCVRIAKCRTTWVAPGLPIEAYLSRSKPAGHIQGT